MFKFDLQTHIAPQLKFYINNNQATFAATPPVNTAPSSSLTSPHKIGPASYGLQPRPGSVYCDNQEADTSVDINQLVLQPAVPSYMYSNESPAKHEKRRRTRAQKQLRSKLGLFSLNSTNEEESDAEVVSSQQRNLVVKQLIRVSTAQTWSIVLQDHIQQG
ncbi:hypothetical protein PGT21_000232 [Puccinia graminis f. sp. tritici]|uniref:Uncharacterized protein n=1 Tax=Puccinia graminis f. sp. tritici TaxID=56615 RepID=A0A5B0P4T3_PUCGR|nr:hypothetical protein PGT21_000232 [Puccinia graminis f. sp. tritici]